MAEALISCILGTRVSRLEYLSTQDAKRSKPDARGVRMDVYAEAEDAWYNVEMQVADMEEPALRCRAYQGVNDAASLKKGTEYGELKRSWIIFLCKSDPFRRRALERGAKFAPEWRYEFEMRCAAHPELGAVGEMTWLFLIASEWRRCGDAAIAELLEYVEKGVPRDNPGDLVAAIDQQVGMANLGSKDWRDIMITREQKEASNLRAAESKGRFEGKVEGLAEGKAEGKVEGLAEGKTERKAQTSALKAAMAADGRLGEFLDSIDDDGLFDRLVAEYGIG